VIVVLTKPGPLNSLESAPFMAFGMPVVNFVPVQLWRWHSFYLGCPSRLESEVYSCGHSDSAESY
jgi:hypothetical protein